MGKKFDVHKAIGIFLIIIGILPFLGINFGLLSKLVHLVTIICGVIILLTK